MEAFGGGVRSEVEAAVILGAALIQQRQRHVLSERPRQQSVEVAVHQDHVQGQVRPPPVTVPVQIRPGRHFVAAAPGVERHAGQARWLTFGLGLSPPPEAVDLPDEFPVVGGGGELLQVQLLAAELSSVELKEVGVVTQLLLQRFCREKTQSRSRCRHHAVTITAPSGGGASSPR